MQHLRERNYWLLKINIRISKSFKLDIAYKINQLSAVFIRSPIVAINMLRRRIGITNITEKKSTAVASGNLLSSKCLYCKTLQVKTFLTDHCNAYKKSGSLIITIFWCWLKVEPVFSKLKCRQVHDFFDQSKLDSLMMLWIISEVHVGPHSKFVDVLVKSKVTC